MKTKLIILMMIFAFASCSKEEVKPRDDKPTNTELTNQERIDGFSDYLNGGTFELAYHNDYFAGDVGELEEYGTPSTVSFNNGVYVSENSGNEYVGNYTVLIDGTEIKLEVTYPNGNKLGGNGGIVLYSMSDDEFKTVHNYYTLNTYVRLQ